MDPIAILAAFNAAMQLAAMLFDAYQKSEATPEEKAAARQAALGRFDRAADAVAGAVPPPAA